MYIYIFICKYLYLCVYTPKHTNHSRGLMHAALFYYIQGNYILVL